MSRYTCTIGRRCCGGQIGGESGDGDEEEGLRAGRWRVAGMRGGVVRGRAAGEGWGSFGGWH